MDYPEIYAACRNRVVELVVDLPPDDLARAVPGTPGWTVQDVVAHLAGVAADVVAGNTEGAGTPPWTARQVAERKDRTMAEVAAEWVAAGPAVDPVTAAAPRMVFDAVVHEQDIRSALGRQGPGDDATVDAILQAAVAGLGRRLERAGSPALRLVATETEWIVGPGEPAATVSLSHAELFRVLFGRRSQAQVRAYAWDGDCEPYLPWFNVFGTLPDADVVEN